MKILFLHSNQQSYITESLFHGMRTLLGNNCVDVPRYDSMYQPLTNGIISKLRGNGFTLYGLLKDTKQLIEERFFWRKFLKSYDLIFIGGIWHLEQSEHLWELYKIHKIDPKKIVIICNSDSPVFFPFASIKWRLMNYPWHFLIPMKKFSYLKRELIGEGCSYGLNRIIPRYFRKWIPLPSNAIPISYSIPEEKITISPLKWMDKSQLFATHIVDSEIANKVKKSFFSQIGSEKYTFQTESEYYKDLEQSKYGITTKRGGWECLRHYEIAANGCVPCFRDLDHKPDTCAPHGLDNSNCIIYHSYEDLMYQINSIDEKQYNKLQYNILQWVNRNTTLERAKQILNLVNS